LYYYFGAPDSDSADDTYDLTCECFNIDGAIASDLEDEAVVGGRNTPPQVKLPAKRDEAQFLADQGMQLEQICELQDRLDEEQKNLRLLQQTLEHERAARAHGGGARERARDVNRRIVEDRAVEPPVFGRASQNVVIASMLLRNMLEPSNPEACRACDEIRGLLETVAIQQAESSASRQRGFASKQPTEPSRQEREASVHPKHAQRNKAASVRERIIERQRHKHGDVQLEATTSKEAGATTTQRIKALQPSHQALGSLATPFTKHYCRLGSAPHDSYQV
jgi:hypothetical protein